MRKTNGGNFGDNHPAIQVTWTLTLFQAHDLKNTTRDLTNKVHDLANKVYDFTNKAYDLANKVSRNMTLLMEYD